MFFVCCGNFRTDSRKYLNRTATTILLWTILIFSITLASIFGYGMYVLIIFFLFACLKGSPHPHIYTTRQFFDEAGGLPRGRYGEN